MRFVLTRDPREFETHAIRFLEERIECNVLVTVLLNVLDRHQAAASPLFAYGVAGNGDVACAALRVPPWPLLTSELDSGSADELIESWLRDDPDVGGVNGPSASARLVAAAWAQHTGGTTGCRMRELMHVLSEVSDPPRPARGRLRLASSAERSLLLGWMQEFAREAGVIGGAEAATMADTRLARGGLLVWDAGTPVSMVGSSPCVGGVVRIGPVYTPAAHRRRGYAGSAVAAISRQALARGARKCMLFTDLANPTSNKIYAEVGYRPFRDWEEHAFQSA